MPRAFRLMMLMIIAAEFGTSARATAQTCSGPATQPATTAPSSQPVCYIGPVSVRVLNPDGSRAPGLPLVVFSNSWVTLADDTQPRFLGKARTDEHGEWYRAELKECMWPTMFYAWDAERRLAGFCPVDDLAKLAETQTVRLRPARWVAGELVAPELVARGDRPKWVCAALYLAKDPKLRNRNLRYYTEADGRFRFLLPPGEYYFDLQGDRLERRDDFTLKVPTGDTPLEISKIELKLSKLARMTGQMAPEWDIEEWSDGNTRTLASFRGRPLLLAFWERGADPRNSIPALFRRFEQAEAAHMPLIAIHPPRLGGLAEPREFLIGYRTDHEDATWEADLKKWPFPTGMDRAPEGVRPDHFIYGRSELPFGEFACPLFVLIDRDGRIIANSQDSKPELDTELKKLADDKP